MVLKKVCANTAYSRTSIEELVECFTYNAPGHNCIKVSKQKIVIKEVLH